MKTWVLFLAMLFMLSCDEERESYVFAYGSEVKFQPGNRYVSEDNALVLQINRISDSRCPEGAYCFWQGEVSVYWYLNQDKTEELVLRSHFKPVDTVGVHLFRLIDVKPYPKLNREIADSERVVTMRIDKLGN